EQGPATPVTIGGVRGGPATSTLRQDRWWVQPVATVLALTGFVAYGLWAALRNGNYYSNPLLSPFYSPCLVSTCQYVYGPIIPSWWTYPALAVLIFPLSFRLTCYYYRKSYYRAFWWSPPACGVADAKARYTGESRFPLVFQNVHRYAWYFGVIFAVILSWDAITAFRFPDGGGMSLGSLILLANAVLIWLYTLSCHSCRHLCGGRLNQFSRAPVRHWVWRRLSVLNKHHMLYAWLSLFWVAWADFYVWLAASGTIHDPRFF
ncbi:MAG: hypothetical protein ACRDZQ_15210, partial [Acidimicrobiales bacterium]